MTESSGGVKSIVEEVNLGNKQQTTGMDHRACAVLQMKSATQKTAPAPSKAPRAGAELDAQADALRLLAAEMRGDGGRS